MNNSLRYLALASLVITNIAVAGAEPSTPKADAKPVAAEVSADAQTPVPDSETPGVGAEPTGGSKEDDGSETATLGDAIEDGIALLDKAYVAVVGTAEKVVAFGKKELTPTKEREKTQLRKDLGNVTTGLWTQAALLKANGEVKYQEGTVKGLTEQAQRAEEEVSKASAALKEAKAETVAKDGQATHKAKVARLSAQVKDAQDRANQVKKDLSHANANLELRKTEKEKAAAERAKYELSILKEAEEKAAVKADDAQENVDKVQKDFDAAKKELKSLKSAHAKLGTLDSAKEARKALDKNIEAAQEKVDAKQEALAQAKEVLEGALKAKKSAAKKVCVAHKDVENNSGMLAGVSAIVTKYPLYVAAGGTAVTLVAVWALYKWNSAAHKVADLETELAEAGLDSDVEVA